MLATLVSLGFLFSIDVSDRIGWATIAFRGSGVHQH